MRAFSLLLLISLVVAAPAPVAEPVEADTGTLEAPSVVEQKVGSVTTYSEPGFKGNRTTTNAWQKCSSNFPYGSIKSIIQGPGAVCQYYQDYDCQAGNHSPSKRISSRQGHWLWPDMQEWSGKVLSFKCDYVSHERTPEASTEVEERSLDSTAFDSPPKSGPAYVTLCSYEEFFGPCLGINAWNRCIDAIWLGWAQSVIQDKGGVCFYYQDNGCNYNGGKTKMREIDSTDGPHSWEYMGDWAGKIVSINCRARGNSKA